MPIPQDKLDAFLKRHLLTKSAVNARSHKYELDEVTELCEMTKEALGNTPMLARLNPPCVIVGDIHGQFYDLLRMFSSMSKDTIGEGEDPTLLGALKYKYMFLGDYIDRGHHSIECIMLVFALKCRYPDKYQLLRGNHETRAINKEYGFHSELSDRFGEEHVDGLWTLFNEVFAWMPVAGLIGNIILCMHGGISPHLEKLSDIEDIPRPLDEPNVSPLAMDLLWSDPMDNVKGYRFNTTRGVSVFFGEDEVQQTCNRLGVKLIVRAHQVMMSGYSLFANRKLITVFSAPRYQADMPNNGAVAIIGADGHLGFCVLKPPKPVAKKNKKNDDNSDSGSIPEGTKGKKTDGTKAADKNRKLLGVDTTASKASDSKSKSKSKETSKGKKKTNAKK